MVLESKYFLGPLNVSLLRRTPMFIHLSTKTLKNVNKLTGNSSFSLRYGQLAPAPCYKSCGEHQ